MSDTQARALAFTDSLEQLLPKDRYTTIEPASTAAEQAAARFKVRNQAGDVFIVDVEHVPTSC